MTIDHPNRIYGNGPAIATAVPTPDALLLLFGDNQDYVRWAIQADHNWSAILQQIKSTEATPAWLAVPLMDVEAYLQWCGHHNVDPNESATRAQWAAYQLIDHTNMDENLLVISGFMPIQYPGDLLCVAFALAAGWRGEELPVGLDWPRQRWSRVRLQLAGYQMFIAVENVGDCHLLIRIVLGQLALRLGHPPVDELPDAGFPPYGSWNNWTAPGLAVWYRPT